MEKEELFVGQLLKLIFKTKLDLNSATGFKVKFTSPSGIESIVDAVCDNKTSGIMYYKFNVDPEVEIDVPGLWKFWAYAVYANGFIPGGSVELEFIKEGEMK